MGYYSIVVCCGLQVLESQLAGGTPVAAADPHWSPPF